MSAHVVVIGGGTAGTLIANRLNRLRPDLRVTVVDPRTEHVYQPALLFTPFNDTKPSRYTRPLADQLREGVEVRHTAVTAVDLESCRVELAGRPGLRFDVLVVASGATLSPKETPGLDGGQAGEPVHTFYTPEGALALRHALADFEGGRLLVSVVDMPIKCPVAPLEFCFLADSYLRARGLRDKVEISFATPLDGAFTRPVASRQLGYMLHDRGIAVIPDFNTAEVDRKSSRLVSYDGRTLGFDLAVVVPAHSGAPYVQRSNGLGDALGFVPADETTLQAKSAPNVFVIGDAAALNTSKAGSVAHFEGEVVAHNVLRYIDGEPLDAQYDGHSNCFIETGDGKAMLIDFNYEQEPVPGRYPWRVGLPLLAESRLNHLGKLAFQWVYWHLLLQGRDIPGVGAQMPTRGKQLNAEDGRTEP